MVPTSTQSGNPSFSHRPSGEPSTGHASTDVPSSMPSELPSISSQASLLPSVDPSRKPGLPSSPPLRPSSLPSANASVSAAPSSGPDESVPCKLGEISCQNGSHHVCIKNDGEGCPCPEGQVVCDADEGYGGWCSDVCCDTEAGEQYCYDIATGKIICSSSSGECPSNTG